MHHRRMKIEIAADKSALGRSAAQAGAAAIRTAIQAKGQARIIVATGASQFEMLDALVAEPLDWSKVSAFHLDEYIGLPATHPASFRSYLQERFVARAPGLASFTPVNGDAPDLAAEIERLNRLVSAAPIDVCFAGVGENGHLAFNDPPADFDTEAPYLVVELDEACRRQQLGEGWFPDLDAVPRQAISMSVRQMMKSAVLILSVPDARKAAAVKGAAEGPITPDVPASIVQRHPAATLYLDPDSAAGLDRSRLFTP
jgi:glucosamine-6-phosphate deaminase